MNMEQYNTESHLTVIDVSIFITYFILLIAVGFYPMLKFNRSTINGYFLANRQMTWIFVGASLFATNMGAEHFIGLASSGAAKGLSVGTFEIAAIGIIQLLGWIFLPVFISAQVSTLPEYMNKRFGGQRIRIYIACLYLLLYILTKISVNIYAASLFIKYAFSWNIYLSITFILILTGLCTASGGLASVMYIDTIQAIIMISGGFIVMILSYIKIGNFTNLYHQFLNATPANTNSSICNQPTMVSFQMLRSASDSDMPWIGFFLGHTPNTIWYWCSDQMMVQRVLAAKSISHARAGTLLAGYLKVLPLFLIIIPGMISRALYPNIVACNQPSICQEICHNERSCTNIAYPALILRILPQGMKGIMLASMLAALVVSLTAIYNSASTLFTVDLYPNFCFLRRNQITTRESMIVGRVFIIIMTILSILWIPFVIQMQGSEIYIYMQQVIAYFAPPIACIYLLAILWKRANETGAFTGLIVGFIFGLVRMILEFSKQPPSCGEEDTRFWFIRRIHFMYYAMFLFWITFFTCVLVSLCTKPPTHAQLFRTTYWTRKAKLNIDQMALTDIVNENNSILSQTVQFPDINSFSQIHIDNSKNSVEELKPELFLNQDIDTEMSQNTRICTTDINFERPRKTNFDLYKLLRQCWSSFCGLNENYTELHQRQTDENRESHDTQDPIIIHNQQRPMIKWLLNGNLILVLLVEIAILVIFSIPAKYTFLKQ